MLGFPIGVLTANAFEWYAHKAWLHDYPKKHRNSIFFSHIRHHKRVRTQGFYDEHYRQSLFQSQEIYFEKTSLVSLCVVTTAAAPVAPFFTLGTYYAAWNYWRCHKKAHMNPEWGKYHLPWHYDHHMNTHQDANWCVTRPWFDYIMGTRVIGEGDHAETNPLGMDLPEWIERPLNRISKRLLPRIYVQLDRHRQEEHQRREKGQEIPIEAVA
ncbi:conserved hypothetical protein [gamma proteobacterium HTCC5015]|nr:conserved hypothetical protein [gamma proteobacterium HTCC5015]